MKIAEHLIPVDCTDVTIVGMVSAMPTTIRPKRTTVIPNIQLGAAGTKHVTDEIHSTNKYDHVRITTVCYAINDVEQ